MTFEFRSLHAMAAAYSATLLKARSNKDYYGNQRSSVNAIHVIASGRAGCF